MNAEPAENANNTITHDAVGEACNQTFEANGPKLNETETLSGPIDKTFESHENVPLELNEDVEMLEVLSLSAREAVTPLKQIFKLDEISRTEETGSLPFNDVSNPTEEISAPHSPETFSTSFHDVSSSKTNEISIREAEATSTTNNWEAAIPTATKVFNTSGNDASESFETTHQLSDISVTEVKKEKIAQADAETTTDISSIALPAETEEEYYQNIDEVLHDRSLNASITDKSVSPNLSPFKEQQEIAPALTVEEFKSETVEEEFKPTVFEEDFKPTNVEEELKPTNVEEEFKPTTVEDFKMPVFSRNENVFTDKIQSRFDVQFKAPAAPVFKQQNFGINDEEFKSCGSSCKILSM